jgi:acyl-CoA reductase-like NAD-dependent aldehyde dehydrogenase
MKALHLMFRRFDLPLPPAGEIDLDVAEMAGWPADLFQAAFSHVWRSFAASRRPRVADFLAPIADELEERRTRLAQLETLARKLARVRRRH